MLLGPSGSSTIDSSSPRISPPAAVPPRSAGRSAWDCAAVAPAADPLAALERVADLCAAVPVAIGLQRDCSAIYSRSAVVLWETVPIWRRTLETDVGAGSLGSGGGGGEVEDIGEHVPGFRGLIPTSPSLSSVRSGFCSKMYHVQGTDTTQTQRRRLRRQWYWGLNTFHPSLSSDF